MLEQRGSDFRSSAIWLLYLCRMSWFFNSAPVRWTEALVANSFFCQSYIVLMIYQSQKWDVKWGERREEIMWSCKCRNNFKGTSLKYIIVVLLMTTNSSTQLSESDWYKWRLQKSKGNKYTKRTQLQKVGPFNPPLRESTTTNMLNNTRSRKPSSNSRFMFSYNKNLYIDRTSLPHAGFLHGWSSTGILNVHPHNWLSLKAVRYLMAWE